MPAGKDVRLSLKGLWPAPAVTQAPEGALQEAEEVVIRRAGLVEPRPGFSRSTTAFGSDVAEPRRVLDFVSDQLGIKPSASSHTAHWRIGGNCDTETGAALAWYEYACKGVTASKNLYLTTKNGIRKVPTPGGAIAYKIGSPRVEGFTSTAATASGVSTAAVLANSIVAYRFVIRRTDANGLVTRSAPSSREIYDNSASGNNQTLTLKVYLHPNISWIALAAGVGDELEVYRTPSSPSLPKDVEYLVRRQEITSTDISNRYVTFVDNTGDASLGAALYTNDAEQGPEAAPGPTPEAKSLALFQGSLFAANLTYPAQLILSTSYGLLAGVPFGRADIAFTNGSASATYADATSSNIGELIEHVSGDYASSTVYVRITNVVGTTITLSQTYIGTSGTKSRYLVPSIKINSEYHPYTHPVGLIQSIRGYNGADASHIADFGLVTAAPGSSLVTAYGAGDIDPHSIGGMAYALVLESLDTSTTLSVNATDPGTVHPVIPVLPVHGATAATFAPDANPNGIAWSRNLEPERFTLDDYDEVGAGTRNILALLSLKNVVLIFKEDGVWRMSGAGESSGFRLDKLDEDVRLLTHEAATVLGNQAYAWTDKGIVIGDENGFDNLTNQALSTALEPAQRTIGVGNTAAYGAWAITNRKDDEVVFGIPSTSDLTASAKLLLFNRRQGSWVNWFVSTGMGCGCYRSSDQTLLFARAVGETLYVERTDMSLAYATADHAITVTISGVSGLDVTIGAGSGWTPAVGDLLIRSSVSAIVTAVASATLFTVDTAVTSGSATAYLAYTSVVTPIATTGKNPGLLKNFGEGATWWGSLKGVREYVMRFTSTLSTSAVSQTKAVSSAAQTSTRAEAFRFVTPKNHARTTRLYPSVRVTQAGSKWELEAVALNFRSMSDRVLRRR